MKSYSKWTDEEVVRLFRFIEDGKKQNNNLSGMFCLYAKLTNRKPNSVRNYYYAELNELENNKERREKLGIDISLHQKVEQKEFTEDETENLVLEILRLTSKGISVRKACMQLAGGDIDKMVRLQNKFRSVVVKNKPLYDKCLSTLKIEKPNVKLQKPNNVVSFVNPKNLLSESDINSLFMGLVRLVQKQTEERVIRENIGLTNANDILKRMIIKINEKEKEIKTLQKMFKLESLKNQKLNTEIQNLRIKNAEKCNKNKELKEFTQKFENKEITKLN